jgi:hypothetical protein
MKLPLKHILLFFTFFLVSLISTAQENYRVVNWNMEQGMSNGFISCMIKDVYGFMWFGTRAGLDRFDGNSFKIFLPIENDPKSLLNKNIQGLIEDSLHNIWVGTDEGLSRYDIKADTFTNFLPMVDTPGSNNMMIPFWVTKDDLYCLESLAKIAVYDLHSLKRKKTVQLSHKLKEPPNPRIQDDFMKRSMLFWRLEAMNNQGRYFPTQPVNWQEVIYWHLENKNIFIGQKACATISSEIQSGLMIRRINAIHPMTNIFTHRV